MLTDLLVEDLGVIGRAELSFEHGCTALTGETGAGKTMLIVALSLLTGGRADRGFVRGGAAEARVEGRFAAPSGHPAVSLLLQHGVLDSRDLDDGEAELVLSRTVPADGRSGKARINGRIVTISVLRAAGAALIEIAGQHEHQRLGEAAHQRALLDAFAGDEAEALATEVAEGVRSLRRLQDRMEELSASERERSRELDVLEYEIDEIEAAHPSPGERAELEAEASRLENAEVIAGGVARAVDDLHGEGGAHERLSSAAAELQALARYDSSLREIAERIEAAAIEAEEAARDLAGRVGEPEPEALEAVRARLDVLAKLRRKYGDDEEEVMSYLDRARARAEELRSAESDLTELGDVLRRTRAEVEARAARLTDLRAAAAPRLARAVEERLAALAMPDGRFEVLLTPRDLFEGGAETVEMLVSANPGEAPKPVSKVASGGELARISLALSLVTATDRHATMVFDEVDAGVGGEAARAVGKALADLSASTQVMLVTHLPQVAAFADRHYKVTKTTAPGHTEARVEHIEGEARVEELSRMLSGLPDSERAKHHARELLELAGA